MFWMKLSTGVRYGRPWLNLPLFLLVCVACATLASAVELTTDDYERALNLNQALRNKVLNADLDITWSDDGRWLWYRLDLEDERRSYRHVNTSTGKHAPAFDHDALTEFLQDEVGVDLDPQRLPIEHMAIDSDGIVRLLVVHEQGVWRVLINNGQVKIEDNAEHNAAERSALQTGPYARTLNSLSSTNLQFVNASTHQVRLEWVDSQGTFKPYATLMPAETHLQHTFAGHVWRMIAEADGTELLRIRAGKEFAVVTIPQASAELKTPTRDNRSDDIPPNVSPDERWEVVARDHNLVLIDRESEEEFALTTTGSQEDSFRGRVHWSPGSKHFIAVQTRRAKTRMVAFVEAAPKGQLQPRLHQIDYPKPGDELDQLRPRLFNIESREEVPVENAHFDRPWSIDRFHWSPDGSTFYLLYNQRGHQALRVIAIDAHTGNTRIVVDEHSDTFINYSNKTYLHHFDESNELLWMSERDGWNHLYLIGRATGKVIRQVTEGPWLVRRVDKVEVTDAGKRLAWLTILGHPAHTGQDLYFEHHARVDIDTGELTLLTKDDGTHTLTFSPDRSHYIDRWSRVDQPPVYELRRSSDGALVCELARADASSLVQVVGRLPEPFVAKGRDGKTDIWGVIYRPANYDPSMRYPVLESIYAGPHGQHVPKSFAAYRRAQRYTELGFIVVQIDGMGTNWRSKAFHDFAWKNIKDAGFPDRIAWLRAAAEHDPAIDITRVGIYGGSAGGQNAMRAVLDHADFYKAAMADCGCHDNRMDKIWWNEAWMGYPVDESYAASSNLEDAHKLNGALLLTVGAMDRNVDPASTFQVVDALIKAEKDFEFIVFPSGGHGAGGSNYGWRRTADFFVRHLGGPEPVTSID